MAAGATAGQPVPRVPAHQHWALTGTGEWVKVGPNSCDNGQSLQFDNFHLNGHLGNPGDGKNFVIDGFGCSVDPNADT